MLGLQPYNINGPAGKICLSKKIWFPPVSVILKPRGDETTVENQDNKILLPLEFNVLVNGSC